MILYHTANPHLRICVNKRGFVADLRRNNWQSGLCRKTTTLAAVHVPDKNRYRDLASSPVSLGFSIFDRRYRPARLPATRLSSRASSGTRACW